MTRRFTSTLAMAAVAACLVASRSLPGYQRRQPRPTQPLVQRGYLWQREWTPAVADALTQAAGKMDGVVILGAEIQWRGATPQTIRASIPWEALKAAKTPLAIALRVAPFGGPFAADDAPLRTLTETAKSLLAAATIHGVNVSEFQLDFDCAQKKLAGYRTWLQALRPLVSPLPLVITTLPAWLDEPEFAALLGGVDGYVLQVHSVPTAQECGRSVLCDPALARKWVAKAAKLGRPFAVALPTYCCLAGYDPAGKLLGVAMDGVQPAWPDLTHVLEFSAKADDLAGLVQEWQTLRPRGLQELLWYRIPVASDVRNWHWPTLTAVMAGRKPLHQLKVLSQGESPLDLALANTGEADESLDVSLVVTWEHAQLVASDALPGWTLQVEQGRAVFSPAPDWRLRLTPGDQQGVGWLRYDSSTTPRLQVSPNHRLLR